MALKGKETLKEVNKIVMITKLLSIDLKVT